MLLVVEFLDFSGDLPRCDTFKLLALADRLERRGRALGPSAGLKRSGYPSWVHGVK